MSDEEEFMGWISDEGGALSSSEEEQELRKELDFFIEKSSRKGKQSKDDFEDEMRQELDKRLSEHQKAECSSVNPDADGATVTAPDGRQFYSDMYYDSDSEEEGKEGGKEKGPFKEKRRVLTNDELLYDPGMDDEDQGWIDQQRKRYEPKLKKRGVPRKMPSSDAVLNCPACFSLLCLDCQRHDIYKTQYRAMFVMNCTVDESQVLHMQAKEIGRSKGKKFKKGTQPDVPDKKESLTAIPEGHELPAEESPPERVSGTFSQNGRVMTRNVGGAVTSNVSSYHPVKCNECGTEVAVYDTDEVYHFFNVITSF